MKLTQEERDVLIAGAIGDAVGFVIEFSNYSKICKTYGENGLTLDMIHPKAPLTVSDDTQMTLFALEALQLGASEEQYRDSFIQWYYTQVNWCHPNIVSALAKLPSMQHQRAPGSTCLGSLNKLERGERPFPINDSKGCGGVMRAAPFAFMRGSTAAEKFQHAILQARVTHGHPSGYLPAGVMALLLNLLMSDRTLTLEYAWYLCKAHFLSKEERHEETYDIIDLAMRIAREKTGDIQADLKRIGEGWVGEEALAVAIYSVMAATSFEDVIKISINHNGDSDSTGTLAAQLWVAKHGLPEKYREWEHRLDIADALEYVTNGENYE